MITGIWWQTDYTSKLHAYIHNIRGFSWEDPISTEWQEVDLKNSHDGFTWDAKKQGKEKRKEIAYLESPVYTNKIILKKIEFSALSWDVKFPEGTRYYSYVDPPYVPFNLGHDLFVQLEVFGCPNYELNKGKAQ